MLDGVTRRYRGRRHAAGPGKVDRRRSRTWYTDAVIAITVGMVLTACTSGTAAPSASPHSIAVNGSDQGQNTTGSAARRIFTDPELTFRYERAWTASTWDVVSTASESIVYLTSQSTHNPCVTSSPASGGTETDCGNPITALAPGGLLINWYSFGLPGTSIALESGRATTLGGRPARLTSGSVDEQCKALGGSSSIDAVIDPDDADGSSSLIQMDACLSHPSQDAQVRDMLRSLRFRQREAPGPFPGHFPAPSADDLCQPLEKNPWAQPLTGSGPLSASATIEAARWCHVTVGAHGIQVQLRQVTGDLVKLSHALQAPLTASPPTSVRCPAGPALPAVLVEILDEHGRVVRPTLPTDACGAVSGTRDALIGSASRVLTEVPVSGASEPGSTSPPPTPSPASPIPASTSSAATP